MIHPDLVRALPPFWELEDLVAAGLGQAAALTVMAARRNGPRLVGDVASLDQERDRRLRFEAAGRSH